MNGVIMMKMTMTKIKQLKDFPLLTGVIVFFILGILAAFSPSCSFKQADSGKCVELVDGTGRTGVYQEYRGSMHVIRLHQGGLVKVPYSADYLPVQCPVNP